MGHWSYIELLWKTQQMPYNSLSILHMSPNHTHWIQHSCKSARTNPTTKRPHTPPTMLIAIQWSDPPNTTMANDWTQNSHMPWCNEDTTNVNLETGYGKLLNSISLVNLHRLRHPHTAMPATHNQGSLIIDTCIGSQLFIDALVGAWMLLFSEPHMTTGDHRMLGLNFDHDILFDNKIPAPDLAITHGVYSNHMPTVHEFNDRVAEECKAAQLFKQTQSLYCKYQLTAANHLELESIDKVLTQILTTNNQCCKKYSPVPWSPTLCKIYLMHCYWKIKLSEARTKWDFSTTLAQICNRLPESPENGKPSQQTFEQYANSFAKFGAMQNPEDRST